MELDDLKKQWKATATNQATDAIKNAIEKKISNIERSGRSISRTFWIEMSITWAIYVVFWVIIFTIRKDMQPYIYKMVILIGVAMLPVVWRLYKAQQWASSFDYSKDVRSNVVAFLKYYKTTLRFYEWGCYITVLLTIILMYTDQSFLQSSMSAKTYVVVYVLACAFIARPYIHIVYGKKVAVFEDFLND